MCILFSEILNSQYGEIAMWLVSRYSIVAYNLRDVFSAGGQLTHINGSKLQYNVPHIVFEILDNAELIKYYLKNPSLIRDELAEFRPDLLNARNPYQVWLQKMDAAINNMRAIKKQSKPIPFIDWFDKGATPKIIIK